MIRSAPFATALTSALIAVVGLCPLPASTIDSDGTG